MGKAKRVRAEREKAPPPVGKQGVDRRLLQAAGVLAVALLAIVAFAVSRGSGTTARPAQVTQGRLAGIQVGPAPWPAEISHLAERLKVLGLPALSQEGTVLHIHAHLDLFVNGRSVVVPGGIGTNDNMFISPVHTHDTSGVIHVESPTQERFSLAEFFAIWGVRFIPTTLGGYKSPQTPLRFYRNGRLLKGDPRKLVLAAHEEIAVVVGKPPKRIPSSYAFAAGE